MTPEQALDKIIEFYNENFRIAKATTEEFWNDKKTKSFVDPLKEIIKTDPNCATQFATKYYNQRWTEAEPYILKSPADAVYYYCSLLHEFKGRWTEAEPYILKNKPKKIFDYYNIAVHYNSKYDYYNNCNENLNEDNCEFANGIWTEAEPIFAKEIKVLRSYVMVNKVESKLLEEKVLKDPDCKHNPKIIYDYACKVLKRRWMEAEHIVMKNTDYAVKYSLRFNVPVDEEINNKVISEAAFSDKELTPYKKKFLEQASRNKKIFKEYLKNLIDNKVISNKTTVEELFDVA
jgi:hypothetical protein